MCAEDVQRCLAQREEWFHRYDTQYIFTHPVEDNCEGDEIDDAQGADLPLVEFQAQGLLREVRAEPLVAYADKEKTNQSAYGDDVTGNAFEGDVAFKRFCSQPQAHDPDGLPCKEI